MDRATLLGVYLLASRLMRAPSSLRRSLLSIAKYRRSASSAAERSYRTSSDLISPPYLGCICSPVVSCARLVHYVAPCCQSRNTGGQLARRLSGRTGPLHRRRIARDSSRFSAEYSSCAYTLPPR